MTENSKREGDEHRAEAEEEHEELGRCWLQHDCEHKGQGKSGPPNSQVRPQGWVEAGLSTQIPGEC